MPPTRPPTGAPGGGLPIVAKLAISIVALIFVGVGYFVVFFGDVDAQISTEKNRETNLRSELTKAQESNKAYQADLEEKTRREKQAQEQKKVLPDEAETPAFLSAIQGVATISGVNLNSFTPRDEVTDQYYAKVPMELTISGRFHQIARFFYGVGQLGRIINIEDIDMVARKQQGKAADEGGDIILDVKCLATAFRAKKASEEATKKRGK
jgi:type IV pilus assembly protein PilO